MGNFYAAFPGILACVDVSAALRHDNTEGGGANFYGLTLISYLDQRLTVNEQRTTSNG
jgi:hypothetical protein